VGPEVRRDPKQLVGAQAVEPGESFPNRSKGRDYQKPSSNHIRITKKQRGPGEQTLKKGGVC
jgi:hypothetical protein